MDLVTSKTYLSIVTYMLPSKLLFPTKIKDENCKTHNETVHFVAGREVLLENDLWKRFMNYHCKRETLSVNLHVIYLHDHRGES